MKSFFQNYLQGRKRGKEKERGKRQFREQGLRLEEVKMVRKARRKAKRWKMGERQRLGRWGRERRATKDQGRGNQRQISWEAKRRGERGVNTMFGREEIMGEEGERDWRG